MRESRSKRLAVVSFVLVSSIAAIGGAPPAAASATCSWTAQTPASSSLSFYDVSFTDSSKGWAAGNDDVTGVTRLLSTVDGGLVWTTHDLGQTGLPWGIDFADETHGIIAGNGLRWTSDGGQNWSWAAPIDDPRFWTWHDVEMVDATTAWAVGSANSVNGSIIKTVDAGATWTLVFSGDKGLFDVHFLDATHGWAVGYAGAILATADGGENWTVQTSGTPQIIPGVAFGDAEHGWAVTTDGSILATTNGGTTWVPQSSGTSHQLRDVDAIDATHAIAVGYGGTVLSTTDAGATWTSEGPGGDTGLETVEAVDGDHAWMGGYHASIYERSCQESGGGGTNSTPVCTDGSATTAEDTAKNLHLACGDAEGDAMSYEIVTGPAHGALSGDLPDPTYTPAPNFNGSDAFTFRARDASGVSEVATASITVTSVNDPPAALPQDVATAEDTSKSVQLAGTDPDGDVLTYATASGPAHGTLLGTNQSRLYTPAANYSGPDSFTFTVSDGVLVSAPATVSIVVSPADEGEIVFMRDLNVWTVTPGGPAPTQLLPARSLHPSWGPGRSTVAFSSDRDQTDNYDIYTADGDGTNVRRIAGMDGSDVFPAVSPDGQRIAFSTHANGYDLWTVNADGSGLQRLTNTPQIQEDAPDWAPDGFSLYFQAQANTAAANLFRIGADGTNLIQLTTGAWRDTYPDVSPDGSRIAFTSDRSGSEQVYVMNANGTGVAMLTNGAGGSYPSWSPDGSQIVFGGSAGLEVMAADGTGRTSIAGTARGFGPDWGRPQSVPPPPPGPSADLSVTVSGPPSVASSGTVQYVAAVTNSGTGSGTDVTAVATVSGFTTISASTAAGPCDVSGSVVTCSLGTLTPSASASITVTVVAQAAGSVGIVVQVSCSCENQGTNTRAEATTTILAPPDPHVTVIGPALPIYNGDTFVLKTTVYNPTDVARAFTFVWSRTTTTDKAVNVVRIVRFPGGTCPGPSPGYTGSGNCSLGTIPAGGSVVVEMTIVMNYASSTTFTVGLLCSCGDPNIENNQLTLQVPVGLRSNLTGGFKLPTNVIDGQPFSWTTWISNPCKCKVPVPGTIVIDLPPSLVIDGPLPAFPSGSCTRTGPNQITCTSTNLPYGQTNISIRVIPTQTGPLQGTIHILCTCHDPVDDGVIFSPVVNINPSADLVVGVVGPTQSYEREVVTWTATVTNKGPSISRGVIFRTTLPGGVTLTRLPQVFRNGVLVTTCTFDSGTRELRCDIGDLAKGDAVTIVIVVQCDSAGKLSLKAVVSSGTPDPAIGSNTGRSPTLIISPSADLYVTNSCAEQTYRVGNTAVCQITFGNTGPSSATGTYDIAIPAGWVVTGPYTPSRGSCRVVSTSPLRLRCSTAGLPAGSVGVLSLRVTFSSVGNGVITVVIACGCHDLDPADNSVSLPTTVSGDCLEDRILFVSDRDGDREIYSMNRDGSDQRNLTQSPSTDDFEPSWAPDHRHFAYSSAPAGGVHQLILGTVDVTGCVVTMGPIPNQPRSQNVHAAWAPDSYALSYTSWESRSYNLRIINRDGSGSKRLTSGLGTESISSWSADGKLIAYQGESPDGNNWDIYVISSGSKPKNLTADQDGNAYGPDWSYGSPGTLVYHRAEQGSPNFDLYTTTATGSSKRVIVGSADFTESDADWGYPDDARIFFTRESNVEVDGDQEVWVRGRSGGLTNLTRHSGDDSDPSS